MIIHSLDSEKTLKTIRHFNIQDINFVLFYITLLLNKIIVTSEVKNRRKNPGNKKNIRLSSISLFNQVACFLAIMIEKSLIKSPFSISTSSNLKMVFKHNISTVLSVLKFPVIFDNKE